LVKNLQFWFVNFVVVLAVSAKNVCSQTHHQ